MKFCYTDESGARGVDSKDLTNLMTGIYVDATKVSKYKLEFIKLKEKLFDLYENEGGKRPSEIKSYQIYEGKNNWSSIDPNIRKIFFTKCLKNIKQASSKIFIGVTEFKKYDESNSDLKKGLAGDWQCIATHIALQLQSYNFKGNYKEKTLVVFDDHYGDIKNIYNFLHTNKLAHDFYAHKTGRIQNKELKASEIMHQIIDILAVDSKSSEWNQMADIVAYIIRRYVELNFEGEEKYSGDKKDIDNLYKIIKPNIICQQSFFEKQGALFGELAPNGIRELLK